MQRSIPGANAIGTARSFAKLYSSLDQLVDPKTVELALCALCGPVGIRCSVSRLRSVLALSSKHKTCPDGPASHRVRARRYRWVAAHGRWVKEGVGFSYAMNLLRDDGRGKRAARLLGALHWTR